MAKRIKTPEDAAAALQEADDILELVVMADEAVSFNLATFSALQRARAEVTIAARGVLEPTDDEEEDEDDE